VGDKSAKPGLAFQLKGADEQSSRKDARIGNDPGVCFLPRQPGGSETVQAVAFPIISR